MIKTLSNLLQQDKEKYRVPRRVQDVIPIRRIWPDGIFLVGNKYSKMYRFTDINYLVASRADKESMFLLYSELLNSLDAGATAKITINNRRLNRVNFEKNILMPLRGDAQDIYRREYNRMLLDKAMDGNGIIQEKYITVTVLKKDTEEARSYFARTGADLCSHFAALGAKCTELDATERLRVLHDFYRVGEEVDFHFDAKDMMQKGHDFRDYICPDSIEKDIGPPKDRQTLLPGAVSQGLRFLYQGLSGNGTDGSEPEHDALHRHCPRPNRRGSPRGGNAAAGRGDEHHQLAAPAERQQ